MPAFDAQLMSRTTGNLTTTESGAFKEIRGTGIHGMSARVVVPTAYHDNDTLYVQVITSADGTNSDEIIQSDTLKTFKTNPRDVYVPFVTTRKYAKILLRPGSTTAANINFGAVKAGFVAGSGFDWTRAVAFE